MKASLGVIRRNLVGTAMIAGALLAPRIDAQELQAESGQQEFAPNTDIPPGMMVFEGDIILPVDYFESRATHTNHLWAGGVVPYQFDANVSSTNQQRMRSAMDVWESVASVNFVVRDGESDYLHIQNSNRNASEGVGPAGGRHDIWIVNWDFEYVMVHELAHALGYWHEQSRLDRDAYIQIEWDNICDCCGANGDLSCAPNFTLRDSGGGEYGPYDFDSVMHYGQCAFSSCSDCGSDAAACRTITVLPPYDTQWQGAIGQLTHLSEWDARVMSFLYPHSNWRFVDRGHSGLELGTFPYPFNSFSEGLNLTPAGGTLWLLQPDQYSGALTINQAIVLRAPLGGARLGG